MSRISAVFTAFAVFVSLVVLSHPATLLGGGPTTRPGGAGVEAAERSAVRAIVQNAAGGPPVEPSAMADAAKAERWLKANGESVRGVAPGPLKNLPWGYSTFRRGGAGEPGRLYLHVFEWHASGKVIAYGLGGEVKRAYLLGDPAKAELPVTKTDRAVVVAGPKQAPDPVDTVVVLEVEGEPKTVPLAVAPGADGTILLHARDVIVHGRTVRYEPEPNKNTVGYWTNAADWVEWRFDVPAAGRYSVEILQGCGKGSGGSTVDFAAGGQVLTIAVQDTGGFQNFVTRQIGQFEFDKAGQYTLTVKPTKKPGLAVMDLRQVVLKPVRK